MVWLGPPRTKMSTVEGGILTSLKFFDVIGGWIWNTFLHAFILYKWYLLTFITYLHMFDIN